MIHIKVNCVALPVNVEKYEKKEYIMTDRGHRFNYEKGALQNKLQINQLSTSILKNSE